MIVLVDLKLIDDNPFQTRQSYPAEAIQDLADNISSLRDARPETLGLIHVPVARPVGHKGEPLRSIDISECRFQVAAGHCRLRAFRLLEGQDHDGWWRMPLDVCDLDDQQMADVAWAENQKRRDLTPIERARALLHALNVFDWTQEQIGKRWGLSQSAVANSVRLLELPSWAIEAIHAGEITERHGRALLGLAGLNQWPSRAFLHRPDNSLRTSEEVEVEVRRLVDERSKPLAGAPWWADFQGWAPANYVAGAKGSCQGCPDRATLLRQDRCTRPLCFGAKAKAYAREVQGPTAAKKMHAEHSWRAVHPMAYYVCTACRITGYADDLSHDWYKSGDPGGPVICADCWRLAELPEPPEPEEEPAPVPSPTPVMRPVSPQAGASPRPEPVMRPAVVGQPGAPRPAPDMRPASRAAAPVVCPTILVVARIMPGDDPPARKVMLTIAQEGSFPANMTSGIYADLPDLVRDLCAAYFAPEPAIPDGDGSEETLYEEKEE